MNFDRNTVIGFVILAALFFGYFYYTNQEQSAYRKQKAREQFVADSIRNVNRPPVDTLAQKIDSARADTMKRIASAGSFRDAANGTEQLVYTENEYLKLTFTNKAAR